MTDTRSRSPWKRAVALACACTFLLFAQGSVSAALAADDWQAWPKKPAAPPVTPAETGAAAAGAAGGEKASAGLSAGTIGWIVLGLGAAIAIGIAASGGDGGTTTPAHH